MGKSDVNIVVSLTIPSKQTLRKRIHSVCPPAVDQITH